ncbi:MAG: adenylate/guanylate cyclase domain-containing protein [Pseudaminobacter sp.]|nr:adenylate/guanylate cyclase domain-containing protein [Pseudaminobacter sp.]
MSFQAAIQQGASLALKPFGRYLGYRVRNPNQRKERGLALLNLVSLATVFSNTGFAIIYALVDFDRYLPFIVALSGFSLVWLLTPLLNRFGELASGTYLWATAAIGLSTYALIAGADAGLQYFLLAGPTILIMILGSKRLWLACFYFLVYLLVFSGIELFFPGKSNIMPMPDRIATLNFIASVCMSAIINFVAAFYTFQRAEASEDALEAEHRRSETLLLNLVPASIALRLKQKPNEIIADDLPAVTILFADIVEFTPRASRLSAHALVSFLNRIFSEFDALAERYGLEKIKTIGDAYMVAGGMPEPREDHAGAVAEMALEMLAATRRLSVEIGEEVAVRIGIHSGPAVAGVIGTRKLFYDVWGDTVNTAARMETHGDPGKIQVTEAAKAAIGGRYVFKERGMTQIKGKGGMRLYLLTGRA